MPSKKLQILGSMTPALDNKIEFLKTTLDGSVKEIHRYYTQIGSTNTVSWDGTGDLINDYFYKISDKYIPVSVLEQGGTISYRNKSDGTITSYNFPSEDVEWNEISDTLETGEPVTMVAMGTAAEGLFYSISTDLPANDGSALTKGSYFYTEASQSEFPCSLTLNNFDFEGAPEKPITFPPPVKPLTWNGDTTGKLVVDGLCKVSDIVPTVADFAAGGTGVLTFSDETIQGELFAVEYQAGFVCIGLITSDGEEGIIGYIIDDSFAAIEGIEAGVWLPAPESFEASSLSYALTINGYAGFGGWGKTEPKYADGKSLYTTLCTVYNDGTFNYSDVSLSGTQEGVNALLTRVATVESDISQNTEEIEKIKTKDIGYVTPQMFGAVADGVVDDTNAVQAALDHGGVVYFPAGRYKVTRQLNAVKSCRIEMFKAYPTTWVDGTAEKPGHLLDYPTNSSENNMGARIETYATDGYGLLLGGGVDVDGLFIRAMAGFTGTLLKYDNTQGFYDYPAQSRISHVKLEINDISVVPDVMFDFTPNAGYNYILEDITIGRNPHKKCCTYGFRCDLSETSAKWAHNVRIKNLCIDIFADYPLYIDSGGSASGWLLDTVVVQGYKYDGFTAVEGHPKHKDMITLKNMKNCCIISGFLWDLFQATYEKAINIENVEELACLGCSIEFDSVETSLKSRMRKPENLNIANLSMDINANEESGGNTLSLSDGNIVRSINIPAVTITDEQMDTGISSWMDEHAAPKEVVGKNRLDVNSEDTVIGYYYWATESKDRVYYDKNSALWTTNYIEAKCGDVIRVSKNGTTHQVYTMMCYDKDKKFIDHYAITSTGAPEGIDYKAPEVLYENTAFVRIAFWTNIPSTPSYDDRLTANLCITINNSDISYEPYETGITGGLADYIILQSPNGTQYTISVDDNGLLSATPV